MRPVIRVDKLGKQYEIGNGLPGYTTFRERMVEVVQKPFTHFRNGSGFKTASASTISPVLDWDTHKLN